MGTDFRGVPGQYTGLSITQRNIFVGNAPPQDQYVPSFKFIDGTKTRDTGNTPVDLLRAGLILGKITSGGKYANSIIGLLGVALHDTSVVTTVMTLPAAVVTEITRRIGTSGTFKITGPPTTAGTVATEVVTFSAIASTTTLTITATSADFILGSIITPNDGSETPLTVLSNPYGLPVADPAGTSIDQPLNLYVRGGDLRATQIINLTEGDASVQTYLKAQLKSAGPYTFDNDR